MIWAIGIYSIGYIALFIFSHAVAAKNPLVRVGLASVPTARVALNCLIWPLLILGVVVETLSLGKK